MRLELKELMTIRQGLIALKEDYDFIYPEFLDKLITKVEQRIEVEE